MSMNPSYPFERNKAGIWNTTNFEKSVEEGIIQTIRTGLGSRPMLKHIGCKINETLFLEADENRNTLAKLYIEEACEESEPNAIIHEVDITNNGEDEIFIHVRYGIIDSAKIGELKIKV